MWEMPYFFGRARRYPSENCDQTSSPMLKGPLIDPRNGRHEVSTTAFPTFTTSLFWVLEWIPAVLVLVRGHPRLTDAID
jgi:hypothetical protein